MGVVAVLCFCVGSQALTNRINILCVALLGGAQAICLLPFQNPIKSLFKKQQQVLRVKSGFIKGFGCDWIAAHRQP